MVESRFWNPKNQQKISIKKCFILRCGYDHFIEEIGRGIFDLLISYMVERPWKGPWKGCLEPGATPPSGCRQRGADCQEQIFRRGALAGRANEICQGTSVAQAFGDAPKDGEPQTHDTLEGEKKKMQKKTNGQKRDISAEMSTSRFRVLTAWPGCEDDQPTNTMRCRPT